MPPEPAEADPESTREEDQHPAPIRALLTRALKEHGYDVVAVNDGAAGLEAVRTATDPYDLVVTNNCMPGDGGRGGDCQDRGRLPRALFDAPRSSFVPQCRPFLDCTLGTLSPP